MSASTNFILRDIANELEKIRIILEREHPPATREWTIPDNSKNPVIRDTDKVDLVKNIIKENFEYATCGIYFTNNLVGDPMVTLMNGDELQIDICYEYQYFEVFGLTDREQKEIEEFYWNIAREKR